MVITDINTLLRFLTKTTAQSLTAAQALILVNNAYERVVGKIIVETAGSNWKFGDSNFTAVPTGLADLVNSQQPYQLMGNLVATTGTGIALQSATTQPLLTVFRVEIMDEDGDYHVIQPITLNQITEGQTQYYETDGRPEYYELREDFIHLYPAPDNGVSVTLTNGLKIFFQRTADLFTSAEVTAGTKYPGFASPWHDILAYMAAYEYAIANGLPNLKILKAEIMEKEKGLLTYYARREQVLRKKMTTGSISFR